MKLLITNNLADRNMMHHIYPLTLLYNVDKIIIIRDTKGPEMDKVYYRCPSKWLLRVPPIAFLYKFILMGYISIQEKPDIIHGYQLFPHGISAYIIGILTRRKVGISLIAGPVELYAPGKSPIGKYSYCKSLPPLNFMAKFMLSILNTCEIITVTGTYSKKFLITNGLNPNKVFILPHVIDYRFKNTNINKEYEIIFVGRLASVKHIETLLKALYIVKKTYPKVKVAIVGDGECKTQLEHLSERCGLSNNVVFVDYQPDVWNWYNKSKISILTSDREGFPYSVIESLNCGVPVIASNCGDVCDVIKDGYNGIIIDDYKDYNSFARAIIKLLNPQIITEYSANALKTAGKMDVEKVACIWKDIIIKNCLEYEN